MQQHFIEDSQMLHKGLIASREEMRKTDLHPGIKPKFCNWNVYIPHKVSPPHSLSLMVNGVPVVCTLVGIPATSDIGLCHIL